MNKTKWLLKLPASAELIARGILLRHNYNFEFLGGANVPGFWNPNERVDVCSFWVSDVNEAQFVKVQAEILTEFRKPSNGDIG